MGIGSGLTSFFRMTIRHNIGSTRRAIGGLTGDLKQTGKAAESLGKQSKAAFAGMGGALSSVGSLVSGLAITFGGFQVVNQIRKWTEELLKFETEFANVLTLIDDADAQAGDLRKQILALGGTLGSATDLTRGLYQALSAGVEPAKAVQFVGESAKFAKAALTDTFTAVDVLTTVINAYGLEATDAANVSDKLFEIIKQGKTTGPELAAAMGRVIPTAAQLNVDINELGAALATMTKGGINTNESVTALNQVLLTFLKPQEKAIKLSKQLGIELNARAIQEKGLAAVLGEVARKVEGNSEATAVFFGNIRALKGVLALTGAQAGEFERILVEMQNTIGNTDEAFKKQANTLSFQFAAAFINIQKLIISVSNETSFLTEVLTDFNKALEEGDIRASSITFTFAALKNGIIGLGILTGIVALVPALTFAWTALTLAATSFISLGLPGVMTALAASFPLLAGSIGAAGLILSGFLASLALLGGVLAGRFLDDYFKLNESTKEYRDNLFIVETAQAQFTKSMIDNAFVLKEQAKLMGKGGEGLVTRLNDLVSAYRRGSIDSDRFKVELESVAKQMLKTRKESENLGGGITALDTAVASLTSKFHKAGESNEALILAVDQLLKSGQSTTKIVEVFGKDLIELSKSSDFATRSLSDQFLAALALAKQMKLDEEALKDTNKLVWKNIEAFNDLEGVLNRSTLARVSNRQEIARSIIANALASKEVDNLVDATKLAAKFFKDLEKNIDKASTSTLKYARSVKDAQVVGRALIVTLKGLSSSTISVDELLKRFNVTSRENIFIQSVFLDKLKELASQGVITYSELNQAQLNLIEDSIQQSRRLSQAQVSMLQELVFSTDFFIADKARTIWKDYIEFIKRSGEELPPEFRKINREIAKDTERWTDDMSELFDKQFADIAVNFASAASDIIFSGKGLVESIGGIAKEFGESFLQTLIVSMFNPLKDEFELLSDFITNVLKNLSSMVVDFFKRAFSGKLLKDLAGPIVDLPFGGAPTGGSATVTATAGSGIGGLLGGLALPAGGAIAGGKLGGLGGALLGGGAGLIAAGGLGLLSGLGSLAAFAGPVGAAIAAAGALILGLKAIFTNSPEEAAVKEAARDFGVGISENFVKSFVKGLGITMKQFEGVRKDILSSPKFIQELIEKTGADTEKLIASFGRLEAFGKTFDLSEPLREAVESGNFEAFNEAWFEVFKNSQRLIAIFGDRIPEALFATSEGLTKAEAAAEAMVESIKNIGREFNVAEEGLSAFVEGFQATKDSIVGIIDEADKLTGGVLALAEVLETNGIPAVDAQNIAWDEFGESIITVFNRLTTLGFEIPPFIQMLIDWAVENEKITFSTGNLAEEIADEEEELGKLSETLKSVRDILEDYNTDLNNSARITGEMAEAILKAGGNIELFNQRVGELEDLKEFQSGILDLKSAIDKLLPSQNTWQGLFLETGKLSKAASKEIIDAGGDIQKFKRFADVQKQKEQFEELQEEFKKTGIISKEFFDAIVDSSPAAAAEILALKKRADDSGISMENLARISESAGKRLDKAMKLAALGVEESFVSAGRALSDELDNIDETIQKTINNLSTALVSAIDLLIAAIGMIPEEMAKAIAKANEILRNGGVSTLLPPIDNLPPPPPDDRNLFEKARDIEREKLLKDPNVFATPFGSLYRTDPDTGVSTKIPGFKDGGFVSDTGLAFLHKGEFVIPKSSVDRNKNSSPQKPTIQITNVFQGDIFGLDDLDNRVADSFTRKFEDGGFSFLVDRTEL